MEWSHYMPSFPREKEKPGRLLSFDDVLLGGGEKEFESVLAVNHGTSVLSEPVGESLGGIADIHLQPCGKHGILLEVAEGDGGTGDDGHAVGDGNGVRFDKLLDAVELFLHG